MITYKNTRSIESKWPGMIVQGENVTEEQAAEILLRTDSHLPTFKYGCNDRAFIAEVQKLFPVAKAGDDLSWSEANAQNTETYKSLDVYLLSNSRIMSSWIGGVHGWCDWDGRIGCNNYNIGKWPSVEDVAEEWAVIAEAFPFLDLRCQLFNGETEVEPILMFTVKDGKVVVEDSDDPLAYFEQIDFIEKVFDRSERGIAIPELKKKIEMVYGNL